MANEATKFIENVVNDVGGLGRPGNSTLTVTPDELRKVLMARLEELGLQIIAEEELAQGSGARH